MSSYYKRFTAEEREFIRNNYLAMSNAKMAQAIGRTAPSVSFQMVKMDLRRPGRKKWTQDELNWLKKNASKFLDRELAARFNTTVNSVKACIMNHKIKPGRNRNFQKGHRPWNFRTKGLMNHTKASQKMQFKKGHLPANTLHDGAITVRLDHPKDRNGRPYKWIRIAPGKWVHYHRYKWEKKNGPVPPGYMVVFKDGDTMNTRLSNLKLMSMAENARRNYNPVKAQKCVKELSDNYIAGRLAGGDQKLRKAIILNMPELVELKRTQLKLNRQIRHEKQNTTRKAAG